MLSRVNWDECGRNKTILQNIFAVRLEPRSTTSNSAGFVFFFWLMMRVICNACGSSKNLSKVGILHLCNSFPDQRMF